MSSHESGLNKDASRLAKLGVEKRRRERERLELIDEFFRDYPDLQEVFMSWHKRRLEGVTACAH
jgi:hypothetical protein